MVILSTWALQSVSLFIGATVLDFQEGAAMWCRRAGPGVTMQCSLTLTIAWWSECHPRSVARAAITTGSTFMLTTMLLGGFYVRKATAPAGPARRRKIRTDGIAVTRMRPLCGSDRGHQVRNMPFWLTWAKYLSITNFVYPVLMQIEFTASNLFECSPVNSAYPACATSTVFPGTEVLEAQNLPTRAGLYIGCVLIFIVGFRTLAYLALRLRRL